MLFPNETICMVVGIVGIVFFVIAIVILFISCKMRNRACCHETHQESKTELKLDGKEDTRESAVFGDQNPELQRYTKNPTNESNLRAKESDEPGEPNYDYARTGEISICTRNETQNSQEESVDHKKENANKNEEETIKKTDEPTVIVDIEVKRKEKTNTKRPIKRKRLKGVAHGAVHYENEVVVTSVKKKEKANANRPNKRTRSKRGTAHYENGTVDSSVKKANDVTENESVQMRETDSTSDLYENGGAKGSSNQRHGNESNLYESMHDVPHEMIAENKDIAENNGDCISISAEGISDNMSPTKLNTDRENGGEQNNENLPLKSNYMENKDNIHGERFQNMDSTRESQVSDLSNDSRKSDESQESNDSNNSGSTDISVRSNTTPKPTSATNLCQDSTAMYMNFFGNHIHVGPGTVVNVQKNEHLVLH